MEVEEIFSNIVAHQIEGIMFHDQMANYYRFLGLKGFAREQEHHFIEETATYQKISRYYVRHYNKLLPQKETANPQAIPSSWFNYKRQDVDTSTRRNAVDEGYTQWIKWEIDTKALYEASARSLYEAGAIASAIVVEKLVSDVERELKNAEEEKLDLEAMSYDLPGIIEMQKEYYERYKK